MNADRHPTKRRVGYSPTAVSTGHPETAERLPDAVVAASLRAQDLGAPKAPHLQSMIDVVGGCTRTGGSSGQQTLSNLEI